MLIIYGLRFALGARLEGERERGDELRERRRDGLIEGVVLNAELRPRLRIEPLVARPGVQVTAGDRDARRAGIEMLREPFGYRDRRRQLAQPPEARVLREFIVVDQTRSVLDRDEVSRIVILRVHVHVADEEDGATNQVARIEQLVTLSEVAHRVQLEPAPEGEGRVHRAARLRRARSDEDLRRLRARYRRAARR